MSREQRRTERRTQRAGASGTAPPSRRTPVKVAGGSRFPIVPIGIAAGVLAVVLLIVYLIIQSGKTGGLSGWEKAEADSSTSIPGVFYPTQGRSHESGTYTPGRAPTPFCDGVPHSGSESATPSGSPTAQGTTASTSTSTPVAGSATAGAGTPNATSTPRTDCYASNPPSSGSHLNVQNKVDLGNGYTLQRIPPLPTVFEPPVEIPRDAIPHILEHAGVFVGYHCAEGDTACQDVVQQLKDIVNDRIDNHDNWVVMALDTDLPEGTAGLSSWTRVLDFKYPDFDKKAVEDFIGTNSCRFDPEKICG
ncbi:MAG: DUF3105 domain-containing protein [Chloroflexota bacterium]|nr:DUF3105 domain-containing protein [Chloroflexota bacterium]